MVVSYVPGELYASHCTITNEVSSTLRSTVADDFQYLNVPEGVTTTSCATAAVTFTIGMADTVADSFLQEIQAMNTINRSILIMHEMFSFCHKTCAEEAHHTDFNSNYFICLLLGLNCCMNRPIRVLVAKVGLDGHDRGAKVIATALRDAGMEVIYTGLRQTPEMVVNAALQEDVDAIGISILSGAHMTIFPKVIQLMKDKKMEDVLLTGGGIIPEDDMRQLNEMGVGKLFAPGTATGDISNYITDWVKQYRSF